MYVGYIVNWTILPNIGLHNMNSMRQGCCTGSFGSRVTLRNGKPKRSMSPEAKPRVTLTSSVCHSSRSPEGLPFLKVTRGPRHYLFCYSQQFYIFMHILIFTISIQTHSFLWVIIRLDL